MRLMALAAVLALSALAGCGDDGDDGARGPGDAPPEDPLTLSVTWDGLTAGSPVEWRFVVRNQSDATVSLTFSSGQDGDVVLVDDAEQVVYRWSEGRMFTQALRERALAAGEELRFALEGTLDAPPGTYSLRATVSAEPAPPPVVERVVVAA